MSGSSRIPKSTVPVKDARGFVRIGTFIRDEGECSYLYYFPGDFVAGDGFELVLSAKDAKDRHTMRELVAGLDKCDCKRCR